MIISLLKVKSRHLRAANTEVQKALPDSWGLFSALKSDRHRALENTMPSKCSNSCFNVLKGNSSDLILNSLSWKVLLHMWETAVKSFILAPGSCTKSDKLPEIVFYQLLSFINVNQCVKLLLLHKKNIHASHVVYFFETTHLLPGSLAFTESICRDCFHCMCILSNIHSYPVSLLVQKVYEENLYSHIFRVKSHALWKQRTNITTLAVH